MDQRYSHPRVTELWSPNWTYAAWMQIEAVTLQAQIEAEIVPDEAKHLPNRMHGRLVDDQTQSDITIYELETKHDVVAFLEWLRHPYGTVGRWIHFGLTSSDVVDTAQGMRFREMHKTIISTLGDLVSEVTRLCGDTTPVMGRTHGQIAEPIDMRVRAYGWMTLLATGAADLSRHTRRMAVCKLSGPVGSYAHNPMEIESAVAAALYLRPHGPGATQIASRAPLAAWAASANLVVQACAKIAHDIRLMGLVGETLAENEAGQVGSSSMAHKVNPVREEKIGGMARMSAGYAAMLSDLGTWLERDISQSSVERVAVPDLWHVTLHATEQTTEVLRNLKLRSSESLDSRDQYVSWLTLRHIEKGLDVDQARRAALLTHQSELPAHDVFMLNWPSE